VSISENQAEKHGKVSSAGSSAEWNRNHT
jgi:hypothetical protein